GKARESRARRKGRGFAPGGDSKPWPDPLGRFRQGAARDLCQGNRSRAQSRSPECLFLAGQRESARGYRSKRKGSGAQENGGVKIVADAFERRHRLSDGIAAKVGERPCERNELFRSCEKCLGSR